MTRYRYATPRPGEDVLTRVPRRTGAPPARTVTGAPYRAPDLLALVVILAVVLAASLAGVRL